MVIIVMITLCTFIIIITIIFSIFTTIICSFPRDMRDNFTKLLNLQVLLKKEHRSCVEMFESYALVSSYMAVYLGPTLCPFYAICLYFHQYPVIWVMTKPQVIFS